MNIRIKEEAVGEILMLLVYDEDRSCGTVFFCSINC